MAAGFTRVVLSCIALAWACSAAAQNFPTKPIRFLVPFPTGGGTDAFARIVSNSLVEALGQQVIVENRPGAEGNIGTALGAKAPPDGYTMVFAHLSSFAVNPWLFREPGFDPIKDFAAVSLGTTQPWLLVVNPTVPAKSMKELAAVARRQPGKLNFASAGSTAAQMAGELFKQITGTEMVHVPYKGASAAMIDVISGNIDMLYSSPAGPTPHVQSGKLRALGVTGSKRLRTLPNVPTIAESGFPEFNGVTGWYGIAVPAGTPKDVIAKLNMEVTRALRSPVVIERLRNAGLDAAPTSPEEFSAIINADYARWGKVIKRSGVKYE